MLAKLAQRVNDEINLPRPRGVSCLQRRRAASFQDIFTTLRGKLSVMPNHHTTLTCKSLVHPDCRRARHQWCPTGCLLRFRLVLTSRKLVSNPGTCISRVDTVTGLCPFLLLILSLQSFGNLRQAKLILLQEKTFHEHLYSSPYLQIFSVKRQSDPSKQT